MGIGFLHQPRPPRGRRRFPPRGRDRSGDAAPVPGGTDHLGVRLTPAPSPGRRPPARVGPSLNTAIRLVGLSPIYKFLCLKNLQKNLPQFIGSHAAIRTNPERQALVFQPSAHPCSYRHVLVHKAEGPPWPSTCCYQTGCAIGDSPTTKLSTGGLTRSGGASGMFYCLPTSGGGSQRAAWS